jgi:hypothetical protein
MAVVVSKRTATRNPTLARRRKARRAALHGRRPVVAHVCDLSRNIIDARRVAGEPVIGWCGFARVPLDLSGRRIVVCGECYREQRRRLG